MYLHNKTQDIVTSKVIVVCSLPQVDLQECISYIVLSKSNLCLYNYYAEFNTKIIFKKQQNTIRHWTMIADEIEPNKYT